MRKSFKSIIKLTALITLILFSSVVIYAANKVSISQAMALPTKDNPNHWQIFVGFSAGFDIPRSLNDVEDPNKTPIKKPGNFYLFDIDSAQRVSIVYVYFDSGPFYTAGTFNGSGHPDAITIFVDPAFRLDPTHHYHLYVLNVSFNGQPTDNPQPGRFVEVAGVRPQAATNRPSKATRRFEIHSRSRPLRIAKTPMSISPVNMPARAEPDSEVR